LSDWNVYAACGTKANAGSGRMATPLHKVNFNPFKIIIMIKNLSNNLAFNPLTQVLVINDTEVQLTTKESQLFDFLSDNVNELSKRDDVLDKVWKSNTFHNARSMDVYMTKLRKHIKPLDNVKILNIHGEGYKLIVINEDLN